MNVLQILDLCDKKEKSVRKEICYINRHRHAVARITCLRPNRQNVSQFSKLLISNDSRP